MSYEYKVYHKETGEEIHEENFAQYFSQYIALDSDGDLVEIDSRDAVVVSVVDFAYIKFNKIDEYEAKVKAYEAKVMAYKAKAKAFDELQSQLKEGKPYDDGYTGWASAQSYDSALRKVLELTKKLEDKYEDKLDDMM